MAQIIPAFLGHPKHLQVLLEASAEGNPGIWADFCATQGPQFSADLRGADLAGKMLADFSLRRARLQNADLSGADLSRADLSEAHLTGAVLTGAVMEGTKLPKPRIKATRPPLEEGGELSRRQRTEHIQEAARRLLEERKAREEEVRQRKESRGQLFRIEDDEEYP